MGERWIKAITAVVLGGISAYMHIIIIPLIVLLAVMIFDYISGLLKAWMLSELNSRVGIKGIIKKIGYLLTVCVASIVDWLIFSGLISVGITIEFNFCFGIIVIIWLIINELISIMENLTALDVPMPNFLKSIIRHLKIAVEAKADAAESEIENGKTRN